MNKKKTAKEQAQPKNRLVSKIYQFRDFFEESRVEMKKVTYPDRKQTLATLGSVLFLVTLIAVFLGLVDVALAKIIEVILP
ncbi:MAG: preprotein translocase subunit SecE [Desulfohalobiaceae bacterium]